MCVVLFFIYWFRLEVIFFNFSFLGFGISVFFVLSFANKIIKKRLYQDKLVTNYLHVVTYVSNPKKIGTTEIEKCTTRNISPYCHLAADPIYYTRRLLIIRSCCCCSNDRAREPQKQMNNLLTIDETEVFMETICFRGKV